MSLVLTIPVLALAPMIQSFLGLEDALGFAGEVATLIDIMLLGHWIEMRSIMGASGALERIVELLPSDARRVRDDGAIEDVPVTELGHGDRVLVKPGEKIPTVNGDRGDQRAATWTGTGATRLTVACARRASPPGLA